VRCLKRTVNGLRKVQWAAGMKEEGSKFRAVVVFKVVTIDTLLVVYVFISTERVALIDDEALQIMLL